MEHMTKEDCQYNKDQCYKTNILPLMEKLDKVEEKVSEIAVDLARLPEKLIERLDARYADKQTVDDMKNNMTWLIRLIIGIVITSLMGIIIIKK